MQGEHFILTARNKNLETFSVKVFVVFLLI